MDHPIPNPAKLLDAWMEWERGELPPGRVMADLKIGGLRDLLETLVAAATAATAATPAAAVVTPAATPPVTAGAEDAVGVETESWTPVV